MIDTHNPTITPYPYQHECLHAIKNTADRGDKTGLVLLAPGLGKTVIAAFEARRRIELNPSSRCLFLCHKNEILEQAQLSFLKVFGPDVSYGFFHGQEKSAHSAQIVFGSFQTTTINLDLFDPSEFDFIVVDETHHVMAPTYLKVIRFFTPNFLLGMTATEDRTDMLDIREIYGKEIFNIPLTEALASGLLTPVDYKMMTDEIISMKKIETKKGKISLSLLNKMLFIPRRDEDMVEIIKNHMKEIKDPRVMVFSPSIEHCELIASLIPGAVPLHSKVSKEEKRTRIELFRQGVFKVIVSVNMFNEAMDVPETNLVAFLRITDSQTIFFQQLGRGLRLFEGKDKVVVLDFVANWERIENVFKLWKEVREKKEGLKLIGKIPQNSNKKGKIEPFMLDIESSGFQEKIIPIIDLINRYRTDFYLTCEEASAAAIKLGIKVKDEYFERYTEDPKLPSSPAYSYKEKFTGWIPFLGGGNYGQAPEGWKTAYKLCTEISHIGEVTIRKWAEEHRLKNPQWFQIYASKIPTEYYHPDLVALIREKGEKIIVPDGWKTAEKLYSDGGLSSPETIKGLVEKYREKNSTWFGHYQGTGKGGGLICEHYHPDLIKKITDEITERKLNQPPKDWKTAIELSREINVSSTSIKTYADSLRKSHPDQFGDFWKETLFVSYFHPDVAKLIKTHFDRPLPEEGWKNLYQAALKGDTSTQYLSDFVKKYRNTNPEWFKLFKTPNGHGTEYFHPNLIEIYVNDIKKSKAPNGWVSINSIVSEIKVGIVAVYKFLNSSGEISNVRPYRINGIMCECCDTSLAKKIREYFLQFKKQSSEWKNVSEMSNMVGVSKFRISTAVKKHRSKNKGWFKMFLSEAENLNKRIVEHFSPELVRIIVEHFKK